MAFRYGVQYRNSDFSSLIGDNFSTYIVQKFGEIRFSDAGVYDVIMCTAVVGHFTVASLPTFDRGRHC